MRRNISNKIVSIFREPNITIKIFALRFFSRVDEGWVFLSSTPRQKRWKLIQRRGCFSRVIGCQCRGPTNARCLAMPARLPVKIIAGVVAINGNAELGNHRSRGGIVLSKSVKAVTRRENDRLLANCIPLCPPLSCLSVSSQSRPPFFFSLLSLCLSLPSLSSTLYSFVFRSHFKSAELPR